MLLGMWDLSSLTRDRTHIPCIARQILNLWTIKEVPKKNVLNKKIILDPPAQSWTASRSSSATPTPTHTHSCVCARAHTHTHTKRTVSSSVSSDGWMVLDYTLPLTKISVNVVSEEVRDGRFLAKVA